ncbi:hypothetical protein Ssi03_06490 [Sphaerisporangium siamense]|nr:hypothetical protein Ssi03_06490 [Sphaerisporangium siamense]
MSPRFWVAYPRGSLKVTRAYSDISRYVRWYTDAITGGQAGAAQESGVEQGDQESGGEGRRA